MKKYYLFILCLYLVVALGIFNKNVLKPRANYDLFTEILQNTKSEVLEYGVRATFSVINEGEKECVDILKGLNLSSDKNIDVFKDKNLYTLEFKAEELSGYISYVQYEDHGTIIINMVENKSTLGLNELRERIERAVNGRRTEIKYFQYVKAKTDISDITYAKDIVASLLQKTGATNIETIDLNKGSSITAYTGYYEQIKNGKAWIDFNCAVSSYESGNYVIIGTPIIMSSY